MILKYNSFNENFSWTAPSKEVHDFILDFYLDLVDEGIEVVIEEYDDKSNSQERVRGGLEDDYRYSVEFDCPRNKYPVESTNHNGVNTINLMLKYGKMFYDSSIAFKNNTGAEIINMTCTNGNRSFHVLFSFPNPLTP